MTVKNGDGHELKEAKFVEIMKTAKERIKSATSIGNGMKIYFNSALLNVLYHVRPSTVLSQ